MGIRGCELKVGLWGCRVCSSRTGRGKARLWVRHACASLAQLTAAYAPVRQFVTLALRGCRSTAWHSTSRHMGCLWAGSLLCSPPAPHVCVPRSSSCIEPGMQECQQHVKNSHRGTMMFVLLPRVPLGSRAGWGHLSDPFATCAVHRGVPAEPCWLRWHLAAPGLL